MPPNKGLVADRLLDLGPGPTKVFTWTSLVVGAILVGLTPPFQVPDEPNHFYRAYQVAEGHLVPQRTSTSVGGVLPQSIPQVAATVMGDVPFNSDVKQDLGAWARAFDVPLLPRDRIEVPFANTALAGPAAYLPQALGIEIARILGASALMVFYSGRVSSLLLCVALTALAVNWLPFRRWTCVLLSLLPMTLFVRSSVSSDGPTLALSLLALAICFRLPDLGARIAGLRETWPLFGVAALLALGKPPYAGVTLLAMATPTRNLGGVRRHATTLFALMAVVVAAQAGWALALRGRTATWAPGADPQAQLVRFAEHPIATGAFLVRDLIASAPVLAHQAVGVLGWLDAPVPNPVPVFLGLMVLLVALGEPGPPWPCAGLRWLAAVICGVGMLVIQAMNYVWWTPPGATHVEGLQGRHLLPLIPFLFLSIEPPDWIARPLSRLRPLLVAAFLVVSATATVLTVVNRYYLDR